MRNIDIYKEEIEMCHYNFGRRISTGDFYCCDEMFCHDCMFEGRYTGDCIPNRIEWLTKNSIDKPRLTKQEKEFINMFVEDFFLTRDDDGCLMLTSATYPFDILIKIQKDLFDFVKSDDGFVWSKKQLLDLETKQIDSM